MRKKFPQAHGVRDTTVPMLQVEENPFELASFPAGAISEIVPAGPDAGILLLVAGLLGEPAEACPHPELVLVDGGDAFDPASFSEMACTKLLWVRCGSSLEMIKAADLVTRDGNVPFVLLDATGLVRRDLASIPASAWWRIKQNAEHNGGRVVILAPHPMVPCARKRMILSANLSLHDFDRTRQELLGRLSTTSEGLRRAT